MPVIQIHALEPPEVERIDLCLAAATESLARGLQCPVAQVWAQFVPVSAMHIGTRPRRFNGHCPIVIVRGRPGRPDNLIRSALSELATAVSFALDLPLDDIWIQWVPVEPGRLFAGGSIQRSDTPT
jgi:hypothetical protein